MSELTVRLKLGLFETYGSNTLLGQIVNQNPTKVMSDYTTIVIVIETTGETYQRKHGGPHLTLMPDYVPLEFAKDILYLTSKGYTIKLKELTVKGD